LPDTQSYSYGKVPIAKNASLSAITTIAAHIDEFPGVSWSSNPIRQYGDLHSLSNIVGYVRQYHERMNINYYIIKVILSKIKQERPALS